MMRPVCTMLILASVILAGCDRLREATNTNVILRGEVFVVTQNSQNIRLGRLPVMVFEKDFFERYLKSKQIEYQKVAERLREDRMRSRGEIIYAERVIEEAKQYNMYNTTSAAQNAWARAREAEEKLPDYKAKNQKLEEPPSNQSISQFYFDSLTVPLSLTKTDSDGKYQLTLQKFKDYVVVAFGSYNSEGLYWMIAVKTTGQDYVDLTLSNDNLVKIEDGAPVLSQY